MRVTNAAAALTVIVTATAPAWAEDRLLDEAVEFTGAVFFASIDVPGMVIGVIRDEETAVAGFGRISEADDTAPDGDTILRVGSITKVFTGAVLASLAADGIVDLTAPLEQELPWDVEVPDQPGRQIRLIDLATHTSGLPREIDVDEGPANDPYRHHDQKAFAAALGTDPLLFAPGTAALYSNFGFDLLPPALAASAGEAYPQLLADRVLGPAGLGDTTFTLSDQQRSRLMQGHDIDGSPLPEIETVPGIRGSGGLYSSANDILRWLGWQMKEGADEADAEMRLLDHASYVRRDSLEVVYGMDESGQMDAISLGWVIMNADGDRPTILQKAGGMQGTFSYAAFAPSRGVGVFVAINRFDFQAAMEMAEVANGLIAQLAPR